MKRTFTILALATFLTSFGVWANSERVVYNENEQIIIEFLSDASGVDRVEQYCNEWGEDTSSNIQTVFMRGISAVLIERLGKERFFTYLRASFKTQGYMTNNAIKNISYWRKSGQLEAIKRYCTEDLPYSRTFIADFLLSAASKIDK